MGEIRGRLRPKGQLLNAEYWGHFPADAIARTVQIGEQLGFRLSDEPKVRWCHAAVFQNAAT